MTNEAIITWLSVPKKIMTLARKKRFIRKEVLKMGRWKNWEKSVWQVFFQINDHHGWSESIINHLTKTAYKLNSLVPFFFLDNPVNSLEQICSENTLMRVCSHELMRLISFLFFWYFPGAHQVTLKLITYKA